MIPNSNPNLQIMEWVMEAHKYDEDQNCFWFEDSSISVTVYYRPIIGWKNVTDEVALECGAPERWLPVSFCTGGKPAIVDRVSDSVFLRDFNEYEPQDEGVRGFCKRMAALERKRIDGEATLHRQIAVLGQ